MMRVGDIVKRRDGSFVNIIRLSDLDKEYPVITVDKRGKLDKYDRYGFYYKAGEKPHKLDLLPNV